jgi:DNA-binding NarL/FixJ family response regulator
MTTPSFPQPSPIAVMIVDDHQVVIDGLQAVLSDLPDIEVIGYANRGDEALANFALFKPEVVLLDIDMPGMSGLVVLEKLQREAELDPKPAIVILSMHLEASVIKEAIAKGAKGYLPKNAHASAVAQAIRTVSRGQSWFAPEVTLALGGASSPLPSPAGENTASDAAKLATLSEREREILIAIAEGQSSREIAEALFLSPRTVDTHRGNLMRKLEIHKVAGLIRFALKQGLVE